MSNEQDRILAAADTIYRHEVMLVLVPFDKLPNDEQRRYMLIAKAVLRAADGIANEKGNQTGSADLYHEPAPGLVPTHCEDAS